MPAKLWLHREKLDVEQFTAWLVQHGIHVVEPKGDYELVRYHYGQNTCFIWDRPSKGRISFDNQSWKHFHRFLDGLSLEKPKKSKRPQFTMHTDASNYHESKVGAWAGILVDPKGTEFEISGAMACDVHSSTTAETMAIANCLHAFLKQKALPHKACVTVVCDNRNAMGYIRRHPNKPKKSRAQGVNDALQTIYELTRKYQITLKARWVKGHQRADTKDRDGQYNRRVDRMCGKHAKKLHATKQAFAKDK